MAETKPIREIEDEPAPRTVREPRQKHAPIPAKTEGAVTMSLPDALGRAADCSNPAEGLAVLEAAGLTPQRAAVMGGISLSAYEALRSADPAAPEWGAFRKSVAEWRDRLSHP